MNYSFGTKLRNFSNNRSFIPQNSILGGFDTIPVRVNRASQLIVGAPRVCPRPVDFFRTICSFRDI